MVESAVAPLERAQKLAAGARVVAVVVSVIVIVAAVTRIMIPPMLEMLRGAELTANWRGIVHFVTTMLAYALLAAPSFMLAGAIRELGDVLDEYSAGRFFTLKSGKAVRKAGEAALLAMAFKIVLSPTLFGFVIGEQRGVVWDYEPFDLGLIAFAAFVMVAGRVLEAAAAIKADSDEII